jgi:hypothetical protein
MQVYKAFFKVIKKNRGLLLIYLVVFMVLALLLTNTYNPPQDTDFSKVKVNIAFINDDNDSLLVAGLKTYLSENANLVDLPDEPEPPELDGWRRAEPPIPDDSCRPHA